LRPSITTGCFSAVRIASKSGLLNWRHSVTIKSASEPASALAWSLTKANPSMPRITRAASTIATGS
jgi:hypothetical protein